MDQTEKKETEVKEEEKQVEAPPSDGEIFDKAFQEAITEPAAKPLEGNHPEKDAAPSEEKITDQPQKDVPATDNVQKEEEHAEPVATPPATQTNWELVAKEMDQKMKSWEGRITAANKRAEEAEKKLKETEASTQAKDTPKADLPDGDAAKILAEFGSEYPTLVEPIKAIAKQIAKEIVETRVKALEPILDGAVRSVKSMETQVSGSVEDQHFSKIRAKHADYETIFKSGALAAWIETQPAFLKPTYQRIVEAGSTEEVIGMFDTFKGANATTPKTPTSPKKKAESLMAVPAAPGVTPAAKGGVDLNDFGAAFKEALSRA